MISKLVPIFSLWLYNLVQPSIISANALSKNNPKSLRGVPILFSLLNFEKFAYCRTLTSRFSHDLQQAVLDSWDNILVFLILQKSWWFFLNWNLLTFTILSFLLVLQNYRIIGFANLCLSPLSHQTQPNVTSRKGVFI